MAEQKKQTTTELIKHELGLKTASGYPDKDKVGNLAVEQIIKISMIKDKDVLHNSFKSVVKSVAGSCNSLGVLIEGVNSKEFCKMADEGKFDMEINSKATNVSSDKKERLKNELEVFKKSMEKELEALKKAKEEQAAKKAAAGAVAEGVAAAPGTEAKPAATEVKKEEAKKEEKAGKK